MEGQQVFVDHFPAWHGLTAEVRAEDQISHIGFGREGLRHTETGAAKFARDQVRGFDGFFRERRSAVGAVEGLHSWLILNQNCDGDNSEEQFQKERYLGLTQLNLLRRSCTAAAAVQLPANCGSPGIESLTQVVAYNIVNGNFGFSLLQLRTGKPYS